MRDRINSYLKDSDVWRDDALENLEEDFSEPDVERILEGAGKFLDGLIETLKAMPEVYYDGPESDSQVVRKLDIGDPQYDNFGQYFADRDALEGIE